MGKSLKLREKMRSGAPEPMVFLWFFVEPTICCPHASGSAPQGPKDGMGVGLDEGLAVFGMRVGGTLGGGLGGRLGEWVGGGDLYVFVN